jgi:hypothetical protein
VHVLISGGYCADDLRHNQAGREGAEQELQAEHLRHKHEHYEQEDDQAHGQLPGCMQCAAGQPAQPTGADPPSKTHPDDHEHEEEV